MLRTTRRSLRFGALLGAALWLRAVAPALGAPPDSASAQGALDRGEPRVAVRLLAHPDAAGARLGVLFELDPGWHLYWRDPGESGLATELRWDVPGAEVGPVAWPAPSAFRESEGLFTTYGYEGRVLLAAQASWRADAPRERIARVHADVLVCEVECIPASFSLERRLDAPDAPRERAVVRALFEEAERQLPLAPAALGLALEASAGAAAPDADLDAELRVRPCRGEAPCSRLTPGAPVFFPDRRGGPLLAVRGVEADAQGGFRVKLRGRASAALAPRLTGVLALVDGAGTPRALDVDLPLSPAAAATAGEAGIGLAQALVLALLGGLVLNLMPCVLPVLALKAVAVAELAHRRRADALAHGLAYLLGVLASLAALAGVVLALRAAGTAVGWGFQFQEPLFVAAVASVLVVFALNLFGVFEIGLDAGRLASLGAQAAGARRSFFDGLLAVVLATPCSAPFLGTAVGFAFAGEAPVILGIFLAIGVGLALPFVLVTAIPGWARWLPRSGPWMLPLRTALGFTLLASAVWLLWIVGRSAGADAMARLLAWLLALGFATWLWAALRALSRPALRVGATLALPLLCLAGVVQVESAGAPPAAGAGEIQLARAYEREAVAAEQRAGRPSFVYFTADWCITCKLNERVVLADERVRQTLAQHGFAVFKADWTRRDERIRAELARFGRSGVPLYLVYPAGDAEPEQLPELLTTKRVLEALGRAAREAPSVRDVTVSPRGTSMDCARADSAQLRETCT